MTSNPSALLCRLVQPAALGMALRIVGCQALAALRARSPVQVMQARDCNYASMPGMARRTSVATLQEELATAMGAPLSRQHAGEEHPVLARCAR
jgi:hypothetical protein